MTLVLKTWRSLKISWSGRDPSELGLKAVTITYLHSHTRYNDTRFALNDSFNDVLDMISACRRSPFSRSLALALPGKKLRVFPRI